MNGMDGIDGMGYGPLDWIGQFNGEVQVEVPARKPLDTKRVYIKRAEITNCKDCRLSDLHSNVRPNIHWNGNNFAIMNRYPRSNKLVTRWITEQLVVNGMTSENDILHLGAVNCEPLDKAGKLVSVAVESFAKCSHHAISTLVAACPTWIFLVGQAPVDIWQGWTRDDGSQFFDATGAPRWVRPGRRGVKKVSKVESEARGRRKPRLMIDECAGRVGVWSEVGAMVCVVSDIGDLTPTGKRIRSKIGVEGVIDRIEMGGKLELLSGICVRWGCEAGVVNYDSDGMGYCNEHWIKE